MGRTGARTWQKEVAPRSGVGSSVEDLWRRKPDRRQQSETMDWAVLLRLGHQLALDFGQVTTSLWDSVPLL